MYLELDINLLTGNKEIDAQHGEWIEKINKLVESCENGVAKIEAVQMLNYMAEYAEFHFEAEEKLQEESGYPAFEEHKQKHEDFRKAVEELHAMLEEEEGPSEAFVNAVKDNVVNWVYNHIKTFDCSVALYINMKLQPELV